MVTEGTAPTDGTAASRVMPPGQSVRTGDDRPSVEVPGAGLGLVVGDGAPGRVGPPRSSTDVDGDVGTGSDERGRHQLADRAAGLFRRWRDGDVAASSELVGLLTPTLWHTARAYRLDAAGAEDSVQNAWLALARRR